MAAPNGEVEPIVFGADELRGAWEASGIRPELAVVVGGGAMVLSGIKRDTPDLDVLVHPGEFRRLSYEPGYGRSSRGPYRSLLLRGMFDAVPFEVAEEFSDAVHVTYEHAVERSVEVDGIRCVDPLQLLTWKAQILTARPDRHDREVADIQSIMSWMLGGPSTRWMRGLSES